MIIIFRFFFSIRTKNVKIKKKDKPTPRPRYLHGRGTLIFRVVPKKRQSKMMTPQVWSEDSHIYQKQYARCEGTEELRTEGLLLAPAVPAPDIHQPSLIAHV